MEMWNYDKIIDEDLESRTKSLPKIKITLNVSRCHKGWCPQTQTLPLMYTIDVWKLQNIVLKISITYNLTHTLVPI
jgi:hypothetical protein